MVAQVLELLRWLGAIGVITIFAIAIPGCFFAPFVAPVDDPDGEDDR